MKKLLIISALFFSAEFVNANPGRGGYLGERFILGTEISYSPFFTSFKDFYTKYNFQYGGNLNVIVGRRTQLGLDYNMYSVGHNELYGSSESYFPGDRIKGTEFGLTLRTFTKKSGSLAPIGKFFDFGMSYSMNKYVAGSDNTSAALNPESFKFTSNQLNTHLALGTQMVFWNHLVANTGARFELPLAQISGTDKSGFMMKRLRNKDYFSVFFGLGVLF